MKNEAIITAIVALVVVGGLVYFFKHTSGSAIGTQAAGLVTGFVGGVGSSVATVANDPSINPLYNVSSSLGGTIYDWFNPAPATP